jgi:hypothetical protein
MGKGFSDVGLKHSVMRKQTSDMGFWLSHAGLSDSYVELGSSSVGLHHSHAGNRGSHVGLRHSHVGNRITDVGNRFSYVGKWFSDMPNQSEPAGNELFDSKTSKNAFWCVLTVRHCDFCRGGWLRAAADAKTDGQSISTGSDSNP